MRMPCRYPTRHTRRAGSLPEPDKATLFAVHIFSDKTTEKAQSLCIDAELPAPPRRAAQARELPRDPSRRSDSITAKTLADSRARGHAEAFSEPSLNLLGAFPREPSREGRPRRC